MVKIGDKVRFLNAVGGGVVRRFDSKDVAFVEDEDGFEVPALVRECVVVVSASEMAGATRTSTGGNSGVKKPDFDKPVLVRERAEGDVLNVLLAFLPADKKALSKTAFDTYLVNDSNYWLIYSYSAQEGTQWRVRHAGMVEPHQKLYLEEVKQADINDLERVSLQLVAFKKDKKYDAKPAVNVEMRIDTVKFYKLHTFQENHYFNDEALIYPVVKNDQPFKAVKVSDQHLEKALREKANVDFIKVRPAKPVRERNGIIELDLHIDSLLDNTSGLSNRDMLEFQLDTVVKTLDQYKQKKGQRIVFIHGKGDGVLRKSLTKMLDQKYRSYGCQDASFKEYGYGATMVTIK